MYGYSYHDRECHLHLVEGGDKRGYALGEIMDCNRQGKHYAGAPQMVAVGSVKLGQRMHLMRILILGYQPVDGSNKRHATEKGYQ